MTTTDLAPEPEAPTRRHHRERRKQRRRVSIVGVIGELLITGGVIVLMFIGWQLYLSELIVGHEERQVATELRDEWNREATTAPPPSETPTAEPEPVVPADPASETPPMYDAPIPVAPAANARFATLLVPRWGADYSRTIAEGISTPEVLDRGRLGHYTNTQMPGETGNFAIAAHRMGHGGSLHYIHELRLGDHIFVETKEGWYRYSFRNLEYVRPTGVGVLNPVPQDTSTAPSEHYITLTSCNPMHTSDERIIAYGVYDGFWPRDAGAPNFGAPAELAPMVAAS